MDKFIPFKFVKSIDDNSRGWVIKRPLLSTFGFRFSLLFTMLTIVFVSGVAQERSDFNSLSRMREDMITDNHVIADEIKLSEDEITTEELETKINVLLEECRRLLGDETNVRLFRENIETSLVSKVARFCPSINIVQLVHENQPFLLNTEVNRQELFFAVDYLTATLNVLKAK